MKQLILLMISLMLLTSCTATDSIIKVEYIKDETPILPIWPTFWPVTWYKQSDMYCFDKDNAKNLLNNVILIDAYHQDVMLFTKESNTLSK